jgi:hypothetical protein
VTQRRLVVVIAMLVSLWTSASWAQTLQAVGFNVESGGARPDVVDDLIASAQDVDLWGFSEVQDAIWATLFAQAAEDGEAGGFGRIMGTTGGGDRLLIVYNRDRFEPVRHPARANPVRGSSCWYASSAWRRDSRPSKPRSSRYHRDGHVSRKSGAVMIGTTAVLTGSPRQKICISE